MYLRMSSQSEQTTERMHVYDSHQIFLQRSLMAVDAAVITDQPPPPPPPPPPPAVHVCHCACAAAEKEKKKKAKKEKRQKKGSLEKKALVESNAAPADLPPPAARRSPLHPGAGDAVIGDVVTRDLFPGSSLRSSLNSMFGGSARQSLDRDLASTVPGAEDDSAAALEGEDAMFSFQEGLGAVRIIYYTAVDIGFRATRVSAARKRGYVRESNPDRPRLTPLTYLQATSAFYHTKGSWMVPCGLITFFISRLSKNLNT